MSELYPLRLEPHFDPRPWGSRDLRPVYTEAPGTEPIGEAWLTWDECRVANGPLAGATLGELCRRFGRELVGEAARETDRFPLLVKFLFPRDKLSVQVHPDDEAAHRVGQPCGKTECWYVLAAEPGAQIGLGLKPGVTRQDLSRAIREVRAEELLNWIDIHAGEMIYVEAGTVHTIGPGSVLVETQQNSDTTYRLYDYGRPRELHIEQGIMAVREKTRAGKVRTGGERLIASPCFVVEKFDLREVREFGGSEEVISPQVLVAINGCGIVRAEGCDPITFARGEAIVVPACIPQATVQPHWTVELMRMSLPAGAVAPPETRW
jgi:mannose-6-phosphate isomerase